MIQGGEFEDKEIKSFYVDGSLSPSLYPVGSPSLNPSISPSSSQSSNPSKSLSDSPSSNPSKYLSDNPTSFSNPPSSNPTLFPLKTKKTKPPTQSPVVLSPSFLHFNFEINNIQSCSSDSGC